MKQLKKHIFVRVMLTVVATVSVCGGQNTQPTEITEGVEGALEPEYDGESGEDGVMKMSVQIGSSTSTTILEDNPAVSSLVQMMEDASVVIGMSDHFGLERAGSLGTNLSASNS